MSDFNKKSLLEIVNLIKTKKVSSLEITNHFIKNIEKGKSIIIIILQKFIFIDNFVSNTIHICTSKFNIHCSPHSDGPAIEIVYLNKPVQVCIMMKEFHTYYPSIISNKFVCKIPFNILRFFCSKII